MSRSAEETTDTGGAENAVNVIILRETKAVKKDLVAVKKDLMALLAVVEQFEDAADGIVGMEPVAAGEANEHEAAPSSLELQSFNAGVVSFRVGMAHMKRHLLAGRNAVDALKCSQQMRVVDPVAAEGEKKETKVTANLMAMPTGVVGNIFSFLKLSEKGPVALSKTCKHFHGIVTLPFLYRHCQLVLGELSTDEVHYYCVRALPLAVLSIGADNFVDILEARPFFKDKRTFSGTFHAVMDLLPRLSLDSKETLAKYAMNAWDHLGESVADTSWGDILYRFGGEAPLFKKLLEYTLRKWTLTTPDYFDTNDGNDLFYSDEGVRIWHLAIHARHYAADNACFEMLLNHEILYGCLKEHCLLDENDDELQAYKAAFLNDDTEALLALLENEESRDQMSASTDIY